MVEREGLDWRDGFLFVGDQLAVDFANTRLDASGNPVELLAAWTDVVRWFVAAGLVSKAASRRLGRRGSTPEAQRALRDVVAFRDQLRKSVARISRGERPARGFTTELNRRLDEHPARLQLRAVRDRVERRVRFEPVQPDELFAPLASAAASLLVDVDPHRVRQCERCVAFFYDASRNGARRWCSMRMCGNRDKVAAYAARQRAAR